MSKTKIVDYALGTGVYTGDLKYGRVSKTNGERSKDFAAQYQDGKPINPPAMPLVLVQTRDPEVWSSERPLVKKAKEKVVNFQHAVNYWIQAFQQKDVGLKANLHLTVGKQRFK